MLWLFLHTIGCWFTHSHPLIVQLTFNKICSHHFYPHFISHSEFSSAAYAHQAIIRFHMPEFIILQQTVYTDKTLTLVFYCFHPEAKTGYSADYTIKFFPQEIS